MKTRIISIILILAMVPMILPISAMAAEKEQSKQEIVLYAVKNAAATIGSISSTKAQELTSAMGIAIEDVFNGENADELIHTVSELPGTISASDLAKSLRNAGAKAAAVSTVNSVVESLSRGDDAYETFGNIVTDGTEAVSTVVISNVTEAGIVALAKVVPAAAVLTSGNGVFIYVIATAAGYAIHVLIESIHMEGTVTSFARNAVSTAATWFNSIVPQKYEKA